MAYVTNDQFGDHRFQELFEAHASMDLPQFKRFLTGLIHNHSVSSNGKKMAFIEDINACNCKDRILQKVTNFFLAGENHKVLKVTKKN
jgi:hypothetical protein